MTTTYSQQSEEKDYARSHGRFRGAWNANDALTPVADPPFTEDDKSEGAYLFVQATSCRRQVLRTVFVNPPSRLFYHPNYFIVSHTLSEPTVPCCDICDPNLLDLVRPGQRPSSTTKKLTYSKHPNMVVVSALREWRRKVLIKDNHPRYLPASYILSEEAINKLARLSPCTESAAKGYLSQQWVFWSTYGSDVTDVIASSQPHCEKIVPSPATIHQDEAQDEGLSAVRDSGDVTQHGKRRPESPIEVLFSSTVTVSGSQPGSQRQKRARRVVPNTPIKSTPSQSPSQPSHHQFSQPILYSNSTVDDITPGHSKLDANRVPPAPPHFIPPPQLPVPSQYHSYPVYPNAPLGPFSPYRPLAPPPSNLPTSQPVMSTMSRACHTPARPTVTPTQALAQASVPSRTRISQHIRHSNIYHPPYHSIPISDPAVSSLQPRTPIVPSHHWSPTVSSAPNMSWPHSQIFGISSPHSPFRSPTAVASSSMGPHIATYQRRSALHSSSLSTPAEPLTPSRPPPPPLQYHQPSPLSGHAHPSMTQFGLFSPFPSPHPMVLPDKNLNNWNFSTP